MTNSGIGSGHLSFGGSNAGAPSLADIGGLAPASRVVVAAAKQRPSPPHWLCFGALQEPTAAR